MIIDPPSRFSPLADWTRFREEMEACLKDAPGNADILEYLELAQSEEERLRAS